MSLIVRAYLFTQPFYSILLPPVDLVHEMSSTVYWNICLWFVAHDCGTTRSGESTSIFLNLLSIDGQLEFKWMMWWYSRKRCRWEIDHRENRGANVFLYFILGSWTPRALLWAQEKDIHCSLSYSDRFFDVVKFQTYIYLFRQMYSLSDKAPTWLVSSTRSFDLIPDISHGKGVIRIVKKNKQFKSILVRLRRWGVYKQASSFFFSFLQPTISVDFFASQPLSKHTFVLS